MLWSWLGKGAPRRAHRCRSRPFFFLRFLLSIFLAAWKLPADLVGFALFFDIRQRTLMLHNLALCGTSCKRDAIELQGS